MFSNDVMLQLSAEYALREAWIRASFAVVLRMHAVNVRYSHPLTDADMGALAALAEAGAASGAGGVCDPGAPGGVCAAGRLPGLHTGPSPPAVAFPALGRR